MTRVRLGAAFVNQTPLAWGRNLAHVSKALELARERGVSLLCLPELALSGYGCEDLFLAPFVVRRSLEALANLVPDTWGLCTAFGLPLEIDGSLYNAMAVCADGRLLGIVLKQHLALDGLHYEPRWFKPWPSGRVVRHRVLGEDVLVGDLSFDLGSVRLGFEICEDAWVGDARPASRLAARGVNLIFSPAASHFAFGKIKVRMDLGTQACRRYGVAYVYSNLMGNESGRVVFDGGAYVLDAAGRLVGQGERFSFGDVGLLESVVDLQTPADTQPDEGRVRSDFWAPEASEPVSRPVAPESRRTDDTNEEFTRALALGLFDYLRKSHARGFALSLSGGADSAACAVLVRFMAQIGVASLGWQGFTGRLPDIPGLADAGGVDGAMPLLLRTLYQASANSTAITRAAASGIAEAVGSRHAAVEIQHFVNDYRELTEGVLGRTLNWADDDLTLQNLQARVRSPGVWALANAEGRLLLATNNRSEAATGYTTMDGDTSGGLAPVAGVGKHFLRGWLRWVETEGPEGLGPIPALKAVNDQAPTAELRPPEDGQTDEGDLMPYAVLDALERSAVLERLAPSEAYESLRSVLPGETPARLKEWTRRFYRLWAHAQWKRERLAVSLHVDDHNVDPRSWCRWPVLNGGFQEEFGGLI